MVNLPLKYEGQQMVDEALNLLALAYFEGKSVDKYTEKILEAIKRDVHQPSERPCATCREITAMVGRPFWCMRVAIQKSERKVVGIALSDSDKDGTTVMRSV